MCHKSFFVIFFFCGDPLLIADLTTEEELMAKCVHLSPCGTSTHVNNNNNNNIIITIISIITSFPFAYSSDFYSCLFVFFYISFLDVYFLFVP